MRLRLLLLFAGFLLLGAAGAVLLSGSSAPASLAGLFADGDAAPIPSSPPGPPGTTPTAAPAPAATRPDRGSLHPLPPSETTAPDPPAPVRPGAAAPADEAPPTAPEAVADDPLAAAALRARLDGLLAQTAPSGPDPTVGLVVVDQRGAERFGYHADSGLIPASTQKLLTAAAALHALGPEHRYSTRVLAAGPPAADGVLTGDVVIRGSGDPTLATPEFAAIVPDRPSTPLAALADQIAAAGVRRITGRVLGDGGAFTGDPLPEGWHPRYLTALDGARSAGLTVNAGRRLRIVNGQLRGEPSEDPVLTTAVELVHLLGQRGVQVDGGAGRLPAGVHRVGLRHRLASVSSAPLTELLTRMVADSDNGIADQLFLTIGLATTGEATWDGAARGVRTALAELALPWSGVHLADGSGLSRANRVSPALLAQLDVAMSRSRLARHWTSAMAVVGERGTLRARLRGSVVDGRARGKTGSLADVRALSGAVLGPDGRRYHFALLANGLDGPGVQAVRALQDELLLTLAEDLYDCERIPLPVPTPAPTEPPDATPAYELVCAAA